MRQCIFRSQEVIYLSQTRIRKLGDIQKTCTFTTHVTILSNVKRVVFFRMHHAMGGA